MGFSKLNKTRVFDIDTSAFEYYDLKALFEEEGPDHIWTIRGAYIGTKSIYDDETPLLALDDRYVNLPVHQLEAVKAILADPKLIAQIKRGEAGFKIETYFQKRFQKQCYSAIFVDKDPE